VCKCVCVEIVSDSLRINVCVCVCVCEGVCMTLIEQTEQLCRDGIARPKINDDLS